MAIKMNVEMTGDTITPGLKRLKQKIPDALRDAIREIAFDIRIKAMELITSGPKTGTTYKRKSVSHQASAPGEAPASDTGDLLSHITVAAHGRYTDVGTEKLHGLYLEGGTKVKDVERIAPRPFLAPALEEHSGRIEAALVEHLRRI